MPRKFLLAMPIIAITGLLALLIAQAANNNKVQKDNRQQLQLPFEAIEFKDIATPILRTNSPTVLVFFNPDCAFCSYEAQAFQENIAAFAQSNLVFVSAAPKAEVVNFAHTYQLAGKAIFMHDANGLSDEQFGIKSVPSLLIYNAEGQLLKHFKGETKIEAVLEVLEGGV